MTYGNHDTDWATSAKGNEWRRIDGHLLVVGQLRDGRWWARLDDDFIEGSWASEAEAKERAEEEAQDLDRYNEYYWGDK